MNPNVLLEELPTSVEVGGASVAISVSHRTGIQAMRLVDDPSVAEENKARVLLYLYYARTVPGSDSARLPCPVKENPVQAIEAALSFFNLAEPRPPETPESRPPTGVRLFDWDWDAARVIADFQREYGIDLSDAAVRMHWWRFWSLFRGLSEQSQTMEAVRIRGAVPDERKMGREAAANLVRRKTALMLPARTEEEAAQLTALRFRWALEL